MEIHLKIIGALLIVLSLIHFLLPQRFDWKTELPRLGLMNRQMMLVHTFFIALVVILMGVLCITSAKELIETPLGNKISLGMCIFWTARLFTQFFVYSSMLWKGKMFETAVHVLFSALWVYISVVFFLIYWNS